VATSSFAVAGFLSPVPMRRPPWTILAVTAVMALHAVTWIGLTIQRPRPQSVITAPQAIQVRWLDAPHPQALPTQQHVEKTAQPVAPEPAVPAKAQTPHRLTAKPPPSAQPAADAAPEPSAPGQFPASANAVAPSPSQGESPPPPIIPPSPAAYLSNPAPVYPEEARRLHLQGRVMLRVLVSAEGLARQVTVDQSSGAPSLDEAASAAVRDWRFVPGSKGGQAVEAWVLVPIVFKLRS